jgi:hypothetical protein
LRHVTDAILNLLRIGGDIDTQNFQLPAIRGHQSRSQADERSLTRAVWSHQSRERAVFYLERNSVECLHDFTSVAPECLLNIATDQDLCIRGRIHRRSSPYRQGDLETGRQTGRQEDKEKRRQGDKETRRQKEKIIA